MVQYVRDAALATAAGCFCVAILVVEGAIATLWRPLPIGVGVGTGVVVEGLFVADTNAVDLWQRPILQFGSVALLVGGAVLSALRGQVWLVAAACWGLLTYFAVLAIVVLGVVDAVSA